MKKVHILREDMEIIVAKLMKFQGVSRQEALDEIDKLVQQHDPNTKIVIVEGFSEKNLKLKK